jgi:hypothetical protein
LQLGSEYVLESLELFDAELLREDIVATVHAIVTFLPAVIDVASIVRVLLCSSSQGSHLLVSLAAGESAVHPACALWFRMVHAL